MPKKLPLSLSASAALFAVVNVTAQTTPDFSLVVPAGPGGQEGNAVAVDSSGNIYLTGQYQGSATIAGVPLSNAGAQDYFLASFDGGGNPRWAVGAGTTGSDYGTGLKLAANGDLLVSASLVTPVDFHGVSLAGPGGRDAVLARIGSNGTRQWAVAVGGGGDDQADDVAVDAEGNIVLVGRLNGVGTIGTTTLGTAGKTRIFLAKFNSSGEILWATAVSSETRGAGSGVAIDGDRNIVVTGQDTIGGTEHILVAKYDATGQRLWATTHAANGSSLGTGIGVDGQNHVYVCGTFATESVTFGATTLDNPNFALRGFVVKYDPSGSPLWASRVGGRAYRLAVQADGTVYTCGFFLGNSGNFDAVTLTGLGSQDGFVTRHDSQGQLTWVKQAGSDSGDILRNLAQDRDGKVYVSGEGEAPAFGLPPFTLPGRVVVARLDTSSTPPVAALTLTLAGEQLILSWPASETGYTLESAEELSQPFADGRLSLTPVPNQPNAFSLPLPTSNVYFRLVKP